MPIDSCAHTFEHLTMEVLPAHFERLQIAIRAARPATDLVGFKSASQAALEKMGRMQDFPGCYVFLNLTEPVYVGISRGVINRLTQHINHRSHYSASLVYRMACIDNPHGLRRDGAMKDEKFLRAFVSSQSRLQKMNVAFVEITNDLELYLFEVYAAMKLDTHQWNSFRTH